MEGARNDATADFVQHNSWPNFFTIYISEAGDVTDGGGGGGGGDYDFSIYLKHGWLMWAAWGILGLL